MNSLSADIIERVTTAIKRAAEGQLRALGFDEQKDPAVWQNSLRDYVSPIALKMRLARATEDFGTPIQRWREMLTNAGTVDIDKLRQQIVGLRQTSEDGKKNYFADAADDLKAVLIRACTRAAINCLEGIQNQRGGATTVTNKIHPTAIISPKARIGKDVEVGAYSVIGEHVTLGDGCRISSHVVISGRTTLGARNEVFPFASLGSAPQDLKYKGEPSELVIGNDNVIREHVTMNTGTEGGGMKTIVGNKCLFMTASHVAHDCKLGNHVILANNATLAGHVEVGDYVVIGGLAAIHQFVRIGAHAMIGGMSGVEHDVIPFGSVMGERASLAGLNLVGLKRRNFDRDAIHALRGAYKRVFEDAEGTLAQRIAEVEKTYGSMDCVKEMLAFMSDKGSRSLCVPKSQAA